MESRHRRNRHEPYGGGERYCQGVFNANEESFRRTVFSMTSPLYPNRMLLEASENARYEAERMSSSRSIFQIQIDKRGVTEEILS